MLVSKLNFYTAQRMLIAVMCVIAILNKVSGHTVVCHVWCVMQPRKLACHTMSIIYRKKENVIFMHMCLRALFSN